MEEKFNNATNNRPDGARPLDSAIISTDIPRYVSQLKEEEAYDKNGKNAITVFKSENVTITLIALKEGQNFHPGQNEATAVMSVYVISGNLSFESLGKESTVKDGQLITLHQQLTFKALAISDSICLLTLFK